MSKALANRVFISYSHKDTAWLERLQIHLKPFERDGLDRWDDSKIRPGDKWQKEIEEALKSATVAVLLISADFLASDFIHESELPPLLTAAEKHGTRILPVILKPCAFSRSRISKFQAFNNPSHPLSSMTESEQEQIFVQIAEIVSNP